MTKPEAKKLVSDLIEEIDYDVWKEYFSDGYAGNDQHKALSRLVNIVLKHVAESERLKEEQKCLRNE